MTEYDYYKVKVIVPQILSLEISSCVTHLVYCSAPCGIALIVDLTEDRWFHTYKKSNHGWTQIPMKVLLTLMR